MLAPFHCGTSRFLLSRPPPLPQCLQLMDWLTSFSQIDSLGSGVRGSGIRSELGQITFIEDVICLFLVSQCPDQTQQLDSGGDPPLPYYVPIRVITRRSGSSFTGKNRSISRRHSCISPGFDGAFRIAGLITSQRQTLYSTLI